MEYSRYPISELHLGKFRDSLEFQSWKVNYKTEVCANSVLPQVTMQWIKDVKVAKSTDDLMTSQSISGRTLFTGFEMFGAKIASALERDYHEMCFSEGESVSKSNAPRITTDSYEECRLLT